MNNNEIYFSNEQSNMIAELFCTGEFGRGLDQSTGLELPLLDIPTVVDPGQLAETVIPALPVTHTLAPTEVRTTTSTATTSSASASVRAVAAASLAAAATTTTTINKRKSSSSVSLEAQRNKKQKNHIESEDKQYLIWILVDVLYCLLSHANV
ncbi:uncharacterized protein EV154DRAFT_481893 [Mucor mucedo]|uniref:uncharacterized protein n=1 Tax=Mucor mucedo TaxID=29922 RepID=UPI00221F81A1|nr:uncharacterized protein EV154DRAFT_481893 [Mucor mucedo]KAI7890762.1 hypothetical protein EV154DRAFT_481893 [Mucor mucedo]